jgi:hypothetical protein
MSLQIAVIVSIYFVFSVDAYCKLPSGIGHPQGISALQAKRRTKISKRGRPPILVKESDSSNRNPAIPEVTQSEEINPNYVQTAALVVNKGTSSQSNEAVRVQEPEAEEEWGVVPEDKTSKFGPSLLDSIQTKFKDRQAEREMLKERSSVKSTRAALGASFESDFNEFNDRLLEGAASRKGGGTSPQGGGGQSESGVVKAVKNALSLVLVADFFVVIVFLVWFLAAAAMQKANPFLLERFQDIFQPVVVPCLTVLMVGSIASGTLGDKKEE